ncbi:lipocalin family protein [Paraferrimonas haliotis]|uniref:Outer membrane lipoprotein Blc n=1 Tax=Paraferrimonas haliotis TaxID=2013866 RepID=A0AA37TNH0_9GAMM|nr:lipocalin family protein [Paraferrimonas haliotis]GLS82898.1 outer membrane lipoprotein Blc [Paraferrimonas haliotis]
MRAVTVLLMSILLSACVGLPDKVSPVSNFELPRYLGTWYEVARLDHSFERGMNQVTANYSMRDDGGVKVLNRGFKTNEQQWQEAEGKAYFVEGTDSGYLKVSFFGPFYGSYVVFELDKQDYQYAFVAGPNHDYLWLLARTPQVSEQLKQRFLNEAKQRGFNTEEIIFVEHPQP